MSSASTKEVLSSDPEKLPVFGKSNAANNKLDSPGEIAPDDPFKWSNKRKWLVTIILATLTFTSTLCSSIWSSTIVVTAKHFDTSETVMLLGVSLFVLGYAFGPLVWGPMSELLGRKIPLFTGHFVFVILQIPIALGNSLPGVLVCRFLAGFFGSAPLVVTSAACADFWDPAHRGTATAVFSIAAYAGPSIGPVIGSFITDSHLGWRWTAWIVLIAGIVFGTNAAIFVPETYAPVLAQRARGIRSVQIENENGFIRDFARKYLSRPGKMLLQEVLLDVMTLYISITYGIMYLTFFAFPYAFSERGWSRSIASLSFLSLMVGVLVSSIGVTLFSTRYYRPRLIARGGKVCAEDRLPLVMLGSIILPVGLFWFAWTSNPTISWVPQIISGFFIGSGIMLIFTNGLVYIIDLYLPLAASAVAANTFIRSFVAAALPLAAPTMYSRLGVAWSTSILAFMCVALIPAPFLFYKYGEKLRRKSKFAFVS